MQSRYYDAKVQRFVSPDEGIYLGVDKYIYLCNIYIYCGDDPLNYFDCNGFSKCYITAPNFAPDDVIKAIMLYRHYYEKKYDKDKLYILNDCKYVGRYVTYYYYYDLYFPEEHWYWFYPRHRFYTYEIVYMRVKDIKKEINTAWPSLKAILDDVSYALGEVYANDITRITMVLYCAATFIVYILPNNVSVKIRYYMAIAVGLDENAVVPICYRYLYKLMRWNYV